MKSSTLKLAIIGILGVFALAGCVPSISFFPGSTRIVGSRRVVTESRNVSGFDGLVVNGAGRVFVDQTGTESLEITTDDNFLPYIFTEVRDGKLMIEFQPNVIPQNVTDLTFRLTVKDFNSIDLTGAVVLQGSAIEADRMTVRVSGAGVVKLSGNVDSLDVNLEGAGAYNSENMQAKRASVTNSGAGAATVRVSDELDATINGIGAITYIGTPRVTRGVYGIGVISRR